MNNKIKIINKKILKNTEIWFIDKKTLNKKIKNIKMLFKNIIN